jgi:predicted transposase/invertase (TIGR01784 family)
MLFDDPDLLRELYCALEGVSLPPDIPVFINTLENVLFMDFNNDISFEIAGKLVVLIEHQSTINPNMTVRLLIYFTRVIEKMVKGSALYSKKKVPIPWPEFYVLYNGTDQFPDEQVLKLSELFEKPQDIGLTTKDKPLIELEVKVININEGRNVEIAKRCKKLAEYSAFIARVREFSNKTGDLKEAVETSVKYCQKHDILKQFLEVHGSEVLNMLTLEWNTEDAIAFAREEGREDGIEEGIITTARNALAKGIPVETVQEITGLDIATLEQLASSKDK